MVATSGAERCAHNAAEDDWDCTLTMALANSSGGNGSSDPSKCATDLPNSSLPKADGEHIKIKYDACNFKDRYVDECTREPLPLELVKSAMCEELNYF